MPNNNNNTYLNVIDRSIRAFNGIWNNLTPKAGLLSNEQKNGTTLVDVSSYGQLVGKLASVISPTGEIVDWTQGTAITTRYGEQVLSLADGASLVKNSDNAYELLFNVEATGYYNNSSILKATISTQPITFSPDSEYVTYTGTDSSLGYYTVSSTTKLIDTVTINEGSVSGSISANSGINDEDLTVAVSSLGLDAGTDISSQALVELGANEQATDTTNYVYLTVSAGAAIGGEVSATANVSTTAGYILGGELDPIGQTKAISKNAETASKTYKLKRGSINVNDEEAAAARATINVADESILTTDPTKGIALTPVIDSITINGTFVEGYVTGGQQIGLGTITFTEDNIDTLYVKTGSVPDQTIDLDSSFTAPEVGGNLSILSNSADSTATPITIGVNSATNPMVGVDSGFIGANDFGTISASGETNIYIKRATNISSTASISENSYQVKDESGIIDASGTLEIEITPEITIPDVTVGSAGLVLTKDDVSFSAGSIASKTIKIAESELEMSRDITLNSTFVGKDSIDETDEISDLATLLYSSNADLERNNRDYFTLTGTVTATAGKGFITTDSSETATFTRYLPKAVLNWVETGEGGEDYIQVTHPGYLPSGTLHEISSVAPSAASVGLGYTTAISNNHFIQPLTAADKESYSENSDYVKITVNKSTVDAGYMSDGKGTITNNEFYLKKGSVTGQSTATLSVTGVTKIESGTNSGKYEAALSATINNNITFNPGYIASSGITAPATQTGTYIMDAAAFSNYAHTTDVTNTGSNNLLAATNGDAKKYSVTPSITACSTTFAASKSGYIASGEQISYAFTATDGIAHGVNNAEASVFWIKPGSKDNGNSTSGYSLTKTTDSLTANVNNNTGILDTISGNFYEISVSGSITGNISLNQGYYGQDEATVKATLSDITKTIKVKKGSVGVVLTTNSTNAISGNDTQNPVTLVSSTQKVEGTKYAKISATATVSTETTVNEGYIKNDSDNKTEVTGTSLSTEAYIKLYENDGATINVDGTNKTVWTATVGQVPNTELPTTDATENQYVILNTEDTYSKRDIKVTLTKDAMGIDVVNQMRKLESRLSGNLNV